MATQRKTLGTLLKEKHKRIEREKKTDPSAGSNKYYVHLFRAASYTVIGADNIHHAWNKATKLWGPYWDRVALLPPGSNKEVTFVSIKEFGKLIKNAHNLWA